jgi:drug/metabolite transporter (DMT)-like permease
MRPVLQSSVPATPVMLARPSPGLAVAFMLVATAFIAGTTLLAKALGTDALGPPLHPLQISHGRFLFAWMTIAVVMAVLRPRFSRLHWGLHVGRTLMGFAGVTCMFAAASMIPLADATAISFLNPVFGMILAIPLLGEKVGKWRWLAAAIAFTGALILIRPGSGAIAPGALVALGAALALGLELTFIKRLAGREAPLQILFVNNSLGVVIATIAVIAVWQPPSAAQWGALVALGCLMATAQACFVSSVARADASFVTPFSYLTLVFAALYDFAIFGVTPTGLSYLGAATIIGGAALLAWREARLSRRAKAAAASGPPATP